MSLYAPPTLPDLKRAYDRGWGSGPDTSHAVKDREEAALAHVARTLETAIAEELEGLVDSVDENVSRRQVLEALSQLARELRTAHADHTGEIPVVTG